MWGTAFWRYRQYASTLDASAAIASLQASTEFLSAGDIQDNVMGVTIDAYPIPQRIGDLLERLAERGDTSANIWHVGVYADRKVVYEPSSTAVDYQMIDGQLYDKVLQPVVGALLRPGFYVRMDGQLGRPQPPGTANAWDQSGVAYCDEVEWRRDSGELVLSLQARDEATITRQRVLAGGY